MIEPSMLLSRNGSWLALAVWSAIALSVLVIAWLTLGRAERRRRK